jgi:hypothetical protein
VWWRNSWRPPEDDEGELDLALGGALGGVMLVAPMAPPGAAREMALKNTHGQLRLILKLKTLLKHLFVR